MINTYEIVQFVLTDLYVAGFWEHDSQSVVAEPLEGIALAAWHDRDGVQGDAVLVGLLLDKSTGQWAIADEALNFIGVFEAGSDMAQVVVPDRVKEAMSHAR